MGIVTYVMKPAIISRFEKKTGKKIVCQTCGKPILKGQPTTAKHNGNKVIHRHKKCFSELYYDCTI